MSEKIKGPGPCDWAVVVPATWFGCGLLPLAPGTWGTLGAVPLVALMSCTLQALPYVAVAAVLTALAIPISSRCARLYRENERITRLNPEAPNYSSELLQHWVKDPARQSEDPGLIVIDEVVGYAWAMAAVPPSATALVLAFLFFRAFDILKVQPAKLIESIGGGAGIVLDDVVAGLYACASTHLVLWLLGTMGIGALP